MWLLESSSHVLVAGPFKSQAEMAKKLGVSQQYVNRQIKQNKFLFHLDGKKVIAYREKEFVGGGKRGSDKEELAMRLGVPQKAVEKVLAKNTSGVVQTPQGEVKIQKLCPGEKPTLPAVRVLWNDDTEKQDFVSFTAAAKELKLHPKTIARAIKAGRDFFTRKADGKQFTFEIPKENTPSRKKPKPLSEEDWRKLVKQERQRVKVAEIQRLYCSCQNWRSIPRTETQIKALQVMCPEQLAAIMKKYSPSKEHQSPSEELAELKRRPAILDEYNRYKGWDPGFYPLEELDRRNKIRRGELEDHSSVETEPQPLSQDPAEETQNESSADEEEEDFRSVSQTAIAVAAQSAIALPSKLGGYAEPVDEDPLELLDNSKQKVEAGIKKCMLFLRNENLWGAAQYQDLVKQQQKIEHREELYYEMRRKYPGWWLDDFVGEFEKNKNRSVQPRNWGRCSGEKL